MVRVLIVGDDRARTATLRRGLTAQGYGVVCARDAVLGSRLAPYVDLAILALRPEAAGAREIADLLDGIDADVPVMVLTGRDGGERERRSIAPETVERAGAVLGASAAAEPQRCEFDGIVVDFARYTATRDGEPIDLSPRELALLRYLVEHRDRAVTRDELLRTVWGSSAETLTRTVDVHVAKLRRKLGDSPHHSRYILTLHRAGYQFIAW